MSLEPLIQIDRFILYVEASGTLTVDQLSLNRHQLHQRGWVVAGPHASRLSGTIPPTSSGASAPIHFTAAVKYDADGLIRMFISLRTNGNRAMRRALAAQGIWLNASSSDNVIGPSIEHAERLPDLQRQFVENTCTCVQHLVGELLAGAPDLDAVMSITEIELNRDFALPGAHLVAHAVQGSSLANSFYIERKLWLDGGQMGELNRACATTWFYQMKGGGAAKFYPKEGQLGRVEFVLDRDAQAAERIASSGPPDSATLTSMITAAKIVAAPALDELEQHVRAVERGIHRPSALARALLPLLSAEAIAPGRGRPPAVSHTDECARVFDELMIAKRVFVPGSRSSSRLRRLLDHLVASGVLIRSTGKFVMYSVAPHLIGAPDGQRA